jgi:hypothetical protein
MRYERWVKEFRPIVNPFRDDAEIDGYVFATHGEEYAFVRRQPPESVWTFIVCDGSRSATWLISSGFHTVNRMGYLVTARPCPTEEMPDVRY